jgi:DNA-directed RNA polymerase specialized sigma24 family protein
MARHSFSFGDTCRKWWRSCATVLKTARDVLRIGSRRRANTDPIATNRRRTAAMAHFLKRLASAFRRLPDKYLRLRKYGTSTESAFFEALANFKTNPSGAESLKKDLINLLRAMDADGRQILRWKLQGYSDSEIANRLGSTPSAVRTRLTRSLNQAARSILPDDRI